MADRTEACPTASHQQRSGAPIAARSCGRVLSVARSRRSILLADAAGRAPHVVVQSGEPCANQSKSSVAESERQPTDVSRMVAVAHTTMNVGMDNTTKTINQPLVRNRSNTTLGEVVGESWYFIKTISSQTNTHTASARQPQPMWTFHIEAFRGGLHRTLAQPCSRNCVQTQTNH